MLRILGLLCLTVFVLSLGAGLVMDNATAKDTTICSITWDDTKDLWYCCCYLGTKPNGDPIVKCNWVADREDCRWPVH